MAKNLSNLFRSICFTMVPFIPILTLHPAYAKDYLKKVNPFVAKISNEIINTGIRYETDEKTGAKYYFKKIKDREIYFSFVDNPPYGPSNNDEITMEQEFSSSFSFPDFLIRNAIVTDRGLDGKVDECSGNCDDPYSYFQAMVIKILKSVKK